MGSSELPDISAQFTAFATADLSLQAAHRLLLHCAAPRPIALTSTQSAAGSANLAPFSYFMAGGANPPSVVISPLTSRSGVPKDTLRNITEIGEYVINVVTYAMREAMNRTSAELPHGVNEWEHAGFTQAQSLLVKPARVLQSPLAMECKLHQVVQHGSGPLSANYIIGAVVCFHVAQVVLNDDADIDPTRLDYIARMGGDWYTRSTADAMFEMSRPG